MLESHPTPGRTSPQGSKGSGGGELAPVPGSTVDPDEAAALMLSFQAGNERAFDELVARHQAGVLRFLHRTVRDEGRAEDLTQEVFLRVYRSRTRYRHTASFQSWLFTIANRLALNEVRATRRRRNVFVDNPPRGSRETDARAVDSWPNDVEGGGASPVEAAERNELAALLERLIDQLPENQRAALQLHRSEDFSYQEIADVLQVSTMAVKSLLVRARESLKSAVERYLSGERPPVGGKP